MVLTTLLRCSFVFIEVVVQYDFCVKGGRVEVLFYVAGEDCDGKIINYVKIGVS